ncbi:hypothetical protein CIB48_g9588 [Xylaria polymorpha]|nr:hypothetical protein CIB48_g9588 [Xylaria polymorpha]
MTVNRKEAAQDVAVILSLLLVIIIMIWVDDSSPYLATGQLSTANARTLVTGVTIAATAFTTFISSRIQYGLIRSLEDRMQELPDDSHLTLNPRSPGDDHYQEPIQKLEQQWRSILKIDTVLEKVKNYQIFLLYLLSGLITTSIVTTFTPTLGTTSIPYHSIIPDTNLGFYSPEINRSCVGICQAPCPDGGNLREAIPWQLDNGSYVYAALDGECPLTFMPLAAAGINTMTPDDYVYVQSGVAVERTAIGAPMTIFTGAVFGNLSSQYGQSLVSLTQCVPVMTSNPVQCQKSGTVSAAPNDPGYEWLVTTSGNITLPERTWYTGGAVIATRLIRNLTRDSAMSNGMIPKYNLDDKIDSVGRIGAVFGAWNDPNGQVPFANYLAGTINDPDESAGKGGHETYAVTCFIDPRSSFEYRRVTLDMRALGRGNGTDYAQYLSGGESCTPLHQTIDIKMFAIAGTASYLLVKENKNIDGNIATLTRLAGSFRKPPYAFPDSTNALEDILGLISGLAVSQIPLSGGGVSAGEVSQGQLDNYSTATIEVVRLGTGSRKSWWLLIPPVGSLVVLCILFIMGIMRQWAPGGRDFIGPDSKRPKLYVAESIYYLMTLGLLSARGTDDKTSAVDTSSVRDSTLSEQTTGLLRSDSRAGYDVLRPLSPALTPHGS